MAKTRDLTARQKRVLCLIVKGTLKNGYQPSMRDLMGTLKISSPNGIACHITALEKKGYLSRGPKHSKRSLGINWGRYYELVEGVA
jgi:repressor LexA